MAAERLHLRSNPERRADWPPAETSLAALARPAKATSDLAANDLTGAIAALRAQTLRYQTAIDNIAQGVSFFDGEQRLILCNRRYLEIYRLSPADAPSGATLREIAERRVAAGDRR